VIAHIVLFNPKPGISAADILVFGQAMAEAFNAIVDLETARIGRRIRVDLGYERPLGDSSYEYAAVLEFDDEAGLVQCLTHPLHERLGRLFWENCASSVISEVEFVDGRDRDAVKMLVK